VSPSTPDLPPDQSLGEIVADRPYQSLYRRYRPQRFDQVRGQEHVTRALRNAVRDDRITHAYLFSGPRGTGKTSTARILAKALNCATPSEGEPCGVCDSCVSIVAGNSFDVHELDAASNNGVDAMRDLVARSALATPGRWKVYIVDEVHMLSTAASNALLKTLEEPPEHVIFVLATTDPQKVLPTIRSRTQHFEFHLLGEDVLEGLLEDVAADAGLELPEGGLGVALRRGRGSARDALSMLDQVAASGAAEDDTDSLAALVAGIAERDTAAALAALDETLRSGQDPQQVAIALVERLRAGFLALVAPGITTSAWHGTPVLDEARLLGTPRCVRAMELVGAAIVAMRDAPEPRITFEVALVRCAHPEADDTVESLLDRLIALERRLEGLEAGGATAPAPQVAGTRPLAPERPAAPPSPRAPVPSSRPEAVTAAAASPATPSPAPTGPVPTSPVTGEPATSGGRPVLGAYLRRSEPSHGEASPTAPAAAAAPVAGSPAPASAPPSAPAGGGAAGAPGRDELVAAWGDHVLTGLRPKVRAYYQAGHFVGTDGADAVFALPNAVHVAQAEPLRNEVVAALGARFGRPVGLRLVVDGAWSPPVGPGETSTVEPPSVTEQAETHEVSGAVHTPGRGRTESEAPGTGRGRPGVSASAPVSAAPGGRTSPRPVAPAATQPDETDDVDDVAPLAETYEIAPDPPDSGLTWAEDRLLRAFPGAEEV
jgi:DNA polymerase-3 subunit gamma/tau